MATLPTVILIRLQLMEQTRKCEQRGVGMEEAVGQRYAGHKTQPRLGTKKLGLQLDSSLFLRQDDRT